VGCSRGYLSGARCRLAHGPADATATHSFASVKSRLVLPYWYRLTQVDPEKGPLNVCVFNYFVLSLLVTSIFFIFLSNLSCHISTSVIFCYCFRYWNVYIFCLPQLWFFGKTLLGCCENQRVRNCWHYLSSECYWGMTDVESFQIRLVNSCGRCFQDSNFLTKMRTVPCSALLWWQNFDLIRLISGDIWL